MPDLSFQIDGVDMVKFAAVPLLSFMIGIQNRNPDEVIHSVLLECQIRIEPRRRQYDPEEQVELDDLFGKPSRWQETMQTLLWTHARVNVPEFIGQVCVNLPVPCTFDLNVAATKYFTGIRHDDIPLIFLFSGTVFYQAEAGLQAARISWDSESRSRLPHSVWRTMMDHYYPNTAWLCGARDVVERLLRYKQQHGLATWEQALSKIMDVADEHFVTTVESAEIAVTSNAS